MSINYASEAGMDKTLHERSLKPHTRQQVRAILDRNAVAINAHADQVPGAARVRTSAEIYGEGGMRADRAAMCEEVNAALAGVGGTEEHEGIALAEAVEMRLDSQSDFRRNWDTALLSLTGNRPDRVATLSAEDKAAVARAIVLCGDDADLVAVVTRGIGRAIRDGAGHLRNPVAIQRIVEGAAANLAEVREAAAGDPAALEAGLELLKGLQTRRAPAGYIKYMIDAARNAQEFSQTQFAKNRNRVFDVFLPDGSLLSTTPAAAADQLARFVLGCEDAVYAQLAGAERTKVQVVMSLLVQQSTFAVIEAPATALDPEGKGTVFGSGGNMDGLTRSFHLERDTAGGITVRFETTVRPTHLIVEGDAIPLGAGSSISGSYALTLSAEKLNTLGELDFANCDNTAANQAMDGNGEQKLRTAVNRLPHDFQLDLAPTTSFSAVLN